MNDGGSFWIGVILSALISVCIVSFGIPGTINKEEWGQGQLVCSRYGEHLEHIGTTASFVPPAPEYHIQCNVTQVDMPKKVFWIKQQNEKTE